MKLDWYLRIKNEYWPVSEVKAGNSRDFPFYVVASPSAVLRSFDLDANAKTH